MHGASGNGWMMSGQIWQSPAPLTPDVVSKGLGPMPDDFKVIYRDGNPPIGP